jgi:acyl CoA:acetate/3-ketoacid CoA transferase beta subunit
MASRGDVCAIAIAETFRGDGAIMASAMGPMPKIGARLAQATFEPDLMMTDGVATMIDGDGEVEAWMPFSKVFDTLWNAKRHVMMGASQIDRFGNQNISCLGDHARPKVQLLGSRGAPGNTICHPTSYWVGRHSARIFVPAVDMVSGIGTNNGAFEIRRVITNLGVFDFESETGTMRVRSLHPGVTFEEAQEATGFAIERPAGDIPVSRDPTETELAVLEQWDPESKVRGRIA